MALACGPEGAQRVLVLPALFDEGNKLRHFTVEAMRVLARHGVASVLPDLPGCNESLAPLAAQDLLTWREAASTAARELACSHVLAIRAAAAIAPALPGWALAPVAGKSALRALLRARVIASKEAGRSESTEDLLQQGKVHGLDLSGYSLGPTMIEQLAGADLPHRELTAIGAGDLGGPPLWLRAEPSHDPAQATRLATLIAQGLAA